MSTNPASPLPGGPFTAPYDFSFTETIGVPIDATPGTKSCELKVVADGATRATQTINVTVPDTMVKKVHCDAGNGNGNEGCDPGKSAPHNRGGDEIGAPVDQGGSTENPGGNNVPAKLSP
jgi:hypothetical protein